MKISKPAYVIAVSALLLLQTGCRVHRPDDIMSPRQMERILYDYHLAQAVVNELPQEDHYERDAYLNWVYEHNGITQEDFDHSLVWYTRYPKEFYKVYRRLNSRIESDYQQALKAESQLKNEAVRIESGDSVDLWYQNRTLLLNTSVQMSKVAFVIGNDTAFHTGDTITLNTAVRFISHTDSVPQTAYMAMSVYYSDSISTRDTLMFESGLSSLSVVLDSIRIFKQLRGSINYIDTTDTRSAMMYVPSVSLIRRHKVSVETSASNTPAEL